MNDLAGVNWRFVPRSGWRTIVDECADCLSDAERREGTRWHNALRREQWFVARVAAKRMVLEACPSLALRSRDVEILSRTEDGVATKPSIRARGVVVRGSLSISHTDRGVLVALTVQSGTRLGVDLATIQHLSRGFRAMWFTKHERAMVPAGDDERAVQLWAGKEAAFKALSHGEKFCPRRYEIRQSESGWVCGNSASLFRPAADLRFAVIDGQVVALALSARWTQRAITAECGP